MSRFGFVHPTLELHDRRLVAFIKHQWLFLHSLSINRPFAARNGEKSQAKVQNVREDSWALRRSAFLPRSRS
jgi:hypothetical protein